MNEEKGVLGLATIRQNRGISLEQISSSTKISVRALEAIERGEFSKLPGGIYNTSYIRQYARAIDYDESALLSYYYQTTGNMPQSEANKPDHPIPEGYRPLSSILGS